MAKRIATAYEFLAAKVSPDLAERLDVVRRQLSDAEERFVSRSEIVRRALRQFLHVTCKTEPSSRPKETIHAN